MRFRVRGFDRTTGEPREYELDAASEDEALHRAGDEGVVVASIDPVDPIDEARRRADDSLRQAAGKAAEAVKGTLGDGADDEAKRQRRADRQKQAKRNLLLAERREREGAPWMVGRVIGGALVFAGLCALIGSCVIANEYNANLYSQANAAVYGLVGVGLIVWGAGMALASWAAAIVTQLRRIVDRLDHPDDFRPKDE